ncbi:hypothetical protein SP41_33 [Salmonella phage 41]|nr:hypothetical protein SP41_33 [Salmonella phage 41]
MLKLPAVRLTTAIFITKDGFADTARTSGTTKRYRPIK